MTLTVFCVVGQYGAWSGLLALCVFSWTGVWAEWPGCPRAEHTILWAWHLTQHRHGQDGITTHLPVHKFTWTGKPKAMIIIMIMTVILHSVEISISSYWIISPSMWKDTFSHKDSSYAKGMFLHGICIFMKSSASLPHHTHRIQHPSCIYFINVLPWAVEKSKSTWFRFS